MAHVVEQWRARREAAAAREAEERETERLRLELAVLQARAAEREAAASSWRVPPRGPLRILRGRRGLEIRACEIPGYPRPADVANLGLDWCPADVGLQFRAFALQAAGAWCAISGGSSSTPDQIATRHAEIHETCDRLESLDVEGCQCPDGYRP